MPQINEYGAPEVAAQGPVGGISPNVEEMGALGRGIENLGTAVSQGSEMLHCREAQKETSNVYSRINALRVTQTEYLQQHASSPKFDIDDFKSKFADQVNQIGETLNTAEGKDYFERQSARLGGSL